MFYLAEALLNEKELRFKKHGGVHAAFGALRRKKDSSRRLLALRPLCETIPRGQLSPAGVGMGRSEDLVRQLPTHRYLSISPC